MNKIYISSVILLILGIIIFIIGSMLKLSHSENGNLVLIIGMLVVAVSGIVLIVTLLKNQKK